MDEHLSLNDEETNPESLEISGDAFIIADEEGRIVDWSPQSRRLFGWSNEEAVGQLLGNLIIPEEQRDAHWNGLERYQKTGEGRIVNRCVELMALHRSGERFPVELTVTPTRIGERMLFCGVVRSTHQQETTTANSRQRVIESRLFQQATARWATADDFESSLKDCVEIMCTVAGWPVGHALVRDQSKNQLVSANVWHFHNDEYYAAIRDASQSQSFQESEGFPGRIWAEGETIWSADIGEDPRFSQDDLAKLGLHGVFGFPVIADGETVSVLEFFTHGVIAPDPQMLMQVGSLSSQLARAMEKRKWEKERLRLAAIVESSYDAIISKDVDGMILTWNAGAQHVYGYSEEEAVGQNISMIFPEGMTLPEPEIQDAIRTGRRLVMFDTKRRCRDGRVIPVSLTISPLKDSHGRVVGASTIERDISDRQRREQQLEQATHQAETANRMKSEFLANISHELRTPMNAIIGMLDLALGEQLHPNIEDYLQTARDSADTLLHLLSDLLDFSRMEAGRFTLDHEPFSIRDVVDSTTKTMSLRANEKGLELMGRVGQDIPDRVSGDGQRIKQVLINLVSNAVKFTEQGEVAVTVDSKLATEGQIQLRFAVRDTGIGIAAEDRDRVFQPFTQLDATTTRQYSGTGLGLAICQELIQKMGGELCLESNLGQGSLFSFEITLPIMRDSTPSTTVVPDLADLPVLVVDDNESNRTILQETLLAWNMRPTVFANARQALENVRETKARGDRYELVIVDALMPEMDGFTLIEKLQEEGIGETAAVLMLSSADRQTFRERCENIDVDGFLEKPVSQSDMLDAVVTVLKGTSNVREVADRIETTRRALRILLAEDTPANQKVVKAILSKRGHHVEIADNGREAIDLHQQKDYDLILMDVQMPTMDGLQATEAIRQLADAQKASIPIIAMTAHARREDRQKCLKAGMDAYVAKPIDARQLLKLIESSHRKKVRTGFDSSSTPTPSSKQKLMNREAALARLDGNQELLQDLVRYFLEDAPRLLETASSAIANDNASDAERAAHSLRGLAANFDADACIAVAEQLEDIARSGRLDQAADVLAALKASVQRLSDELKAEL